MLYIYTCVLFITFAVHVYIIPNIGTFIVSLSSLLLSIIITKCANDFVPLIIGRFYRDDPFIGCYVHALVAPVCSWYLQSVQDLHCFGIHVVVL